MAERRMFAKTIIDSDAFVDMPLSTQALYFHLSMRADDEGFVNSPKKIQRMIGASDDDMRVLAGKKFIIPFETGIVVIKHWKIHNYIRGDRIVETKYTDEKSMLVLNENGAYSLAIKDDVNEIKSLSENGATKRQIAYKESELPYSFDYKIKRVFYGKPCPICGFKMQADVDEMGIGTRNRIPSIQHNVPISKGGAHSIDNISVICKQCNITIQDKATDELNNAEVVKMWDKIVEAERRGIEWFWHPERLNEVDVSQVSVKCQSNDGIGKVSIGKDRLGKDSIDSNNTITASRFAPPTPSDVENYATEKGLTIDADKFCDFYESKGWMVGKNKMKDWKAAVRGWCSRDKTNGTIQRSGKVQASQGFSTERADCVDYNALAWERARQAWAEDEGGDV